MNHNNMHNGGSFKSKPMKDSSVPMGSGPRSVKGIPHNESNIGEGYSFVAKGKASTSATGRYGRAYTGGKKSSGIGHTYRNKYSK